MTDKKKTKRITLARHIVQVLMLVVFAVPVIAVGWSLFGLTSGGDNMVTTPANTPFFGTLSSSTIFGIQTLDPLAMLQVIAASKAFDPMWLVYVLPVVVVYGIIRGRAFCGWVCPANLFLEIVDFLRKKLGIKAEEHVVPRHAKVYVALGVVVLSAIVSVPVFEIISPVGALGKLLVFGSTTGLVTLGAIVLCELFWGHRVWCRALCPLGGCYEVLGKVGLVNVKIDHEACINCDKCKKACLCDPEILVPVVAGDDVIVRAGDCMACGACVDECPTGALKYTIGRPKK